MMAQNLSRLWFSTLCRHFATKELPPGLLYFQSCLVFIFVEKGCVRDRLQILRI